VLKKKNAIREKSFGKHVGKFIANCQFPIPNSYPDASNISLDGSGSYVFFYIEECRRWVWSKINMGLL
jgi:hypothetical protein